MPRAKSENHQPRPGGKEAVSFRVTPDAKRLLAALSGKLGIAQSAVLELAVREMAERKGVE